MQRRSIFINYRRALCTTETRYLYLMLDARFPGEVYQDEESLRGGDEWVPKLEQAVQGAKVVLVLIPPNWIAYPIDDSYLKNKPKGIKRGDLHVEPNDYVRKEIEIALNTEGIVIIPILLNGAEIPRKDQLPESIQGLFERFNIANKGRALDFTNPDIDQFKALFDLIADKANLKQQQQDQHDNFFLPPLEKDFPLPDKLKNVLPASTSPFVGLRPFRREDARLFFGRSREIYNLCSKIFSLDTPKLLLLDGYSGTGKSSLLQAGLIPRIEARGWGWAYGRREEDKTHGLKGVLDKLLQQLQKKGNDNNVLILDQVEEAVTDPIEGIPHELEDLARALRQAVASYANCKFILGFRAEQAARITKILGDQRLLYDDENTLYPLDRIGVQEAISGAATDKQLHKVYQLEFRPSTLPIQIAERLLRGRGNQQVAPLLQVNMELLWQRCKQSDGAVVITSNQLNQFIDHEEALLDHYIHKINKELSSSTAETERILSILNFYVHNEPSSAIRLESEFSENTSLQEDSMANHLQHLLKKYYLLSNIQSGGQPATRLAHDVLAPVIKKRFDREIQLTIDERTERLYEELLNRLKEEMYTLRYSAAQKTLEELLELRIKQEALYPFLAELLFVWSETGIKERAIEMLQLWLQTQDFSEALHQQAQALLQRPTRADVREWLQKAVPGSYADLLNKYYAPKGTVMLKIPGGKLDIGENEDARLAEVATFHLANVPTTWWKYGLYLWATGQSDALETKAPSWGIQGDHPVVNVNWYEAVEYCNWLSSQWELEEVYQISKQKKDAHNKNDNDELKWLVRINSNANGYRLPTEIEWEYAARGGLKSEGYTYAGSNDLDKVGWYNQNSNSKTHPVGLKDPNELGLLDMSGNVWEWCWDWYASHPDPLPQNYKGTDEGNSRVLRGGSWSYIDDDCQVAIRYFDLPDDRIKVVGFRLSQD